MVEYVALLRGINVGGNTLLPMKVLLLLCKKIGLEDVRTYIQSGNVLFTSSFSEEKVKEKLEQVLFEEKKKAILVVIRNADELKSILSQNPFKKESPSQVGVLFFEKPVPATFLNECSISGEEKVKIGKREVYIYYPDGMGRSTLKLPKLALSGTMRNINTLRKLVDLTNERSNKKVSEL